jgi:tRNA G26 N,N-dimethylase Trm1
MNESRHSEDLSFINDSDNNLLAPIATNQPFQKNPVFYQPKQPPNRPTNRTINVLATNRTTAKL